MEKQIKYSLLSNSHYNHSLKDIYPYTSDESQDKILFPVLII